MRRLGLVLAATLAAAIVIDGTAEARRSSPQATSDDLQPAGGTLIPRAVLLGVANGVNLAGTSIVAYEMATGKKALAATAISVLVSVPTVAYLVTEIRSDPKDVLLYGTAA